jgi:arylsulfatase A-like enzyme
MICRILLICIVLLGLAYSSAVAEDQAPPNIVLIYTDDLGYGDVGCYGATRVKTPHIDRLAKEGLRLTDAYAPAATCTPSRYALMTGEYAWRKPGTNILHGNASLIIEPGRFTLPAMLRKSGYVTGCVGKWHLGLGGETLDWNGDIKPGPLEVGFDYCFIIPATGDRVPCVYVENHRVVGLEPDDPIQVSYGKPIGDEPTGRARPDLLKMGLTHGHDQTIINGISRIGYMTGGKKARWVDEDMADDLTRKAVAFVEQHRDRPFFLYFSTHDIHVPRVPHPRFAGQSQCGTRGDVIEQLDWCVGQLLAALDRLGLAENTLVIFTSDNGPVLDDGYADGAVADLGDHRPAGPLRGGKYTVYEGGTRVPTIVRWPARVQPGASAAVVGQIDLLASLAALLKTDLPADAAPDSFNVLPAWLGQSQHGRDHLVQQGRGLAIRAGHWKLIPARDATASSELYNLQRDAGETENLIDQHPEVARRLQRLFDEIRQRGRSRPAE